MFFVFQVNMVNMAFVGKIATDTTTVSMCLDEDTCVTQGYKNYKIYKITKTNKIKWKLQANMIQKPFFTKIENICFANILFIWSKFLNYYHFVKIKKMQQSKIARSE